MVLRLPALLRRTRRLLWPRQTDRRLPHTAMTRGDLCALTGIMFGPAIASSSYSLLSSQDSIAPTMPEFTAQDNWRALGLQSLQLAGATAYIKLRKIDLLPWNLRPTLRGIAIGLGLFAACGVLFDAAYTAYGLFIKCEETHTEGAVKDDDASETAAPISVSPSLIAYAVLNGFYEEFFFLVLCLSLPTKSTRLLYLYSVAARTAFHTYQGLFNAALIGAGLGTVFYLAAVRCPGQRIYPFVLAHALGDIFGVGIYTLLFPQDSVNPQGAIGNA